MLTSAMSLSHRAWLTLAVDGCLPRLARDRDVLDTRIAVACGRVDLPADLVEKELQPVPRRPLPRAVERVPERLLDPPEVGEAGIRPRVASIERIGGAIRVRMETEPVHQRRPAPARPIPLPERLQETDGRGGDVRRRVGIVVTARREPEADHGDAGIDRLERVVRRRQEPSRGGCRDDGAVGVELRTHERRLIRLVEDDEPFHVRVPSRESRHEGREVGDGTRRTRELARRIRIDGERDPQPCLDGNRHRLVECLLVRNHGRAARLEARREHGFLQPAGRHLSKEQGAAVGRVFSGVVVGPDIGSGCGADTRERHRHHDRRRKRCPHVHSDSPPHTLLLRIFGSAVNLPGDS